MLIPALMRDGGDIILQNLALLISRLETNTKASKAENDNRASRLETEKTENDNCIIKFEKSLKSLNQKNYSSQGRHAIYGKWTGRREYNQANEGYFEQQSENRDIKRRLDNLEYAIGKNSRKMVKITDLGKHLQEHGVINTGNLEKKVEERGFVRHINVDEKIKKYWEYHISQTQKADKNIEALLLVNRQDNEAVKQRLSMVEKSNKESIKNMGTRPYNNPTLPPPCWQG